MSQGAIRILTEATSLVQKLKNLLLQKKRLTNEVEWQHLLSLLQVVKDEWQEISIDKKAIIASILKIIQQDMALNSQSFDNLSFEAAQNKNLKTYIKEELDRLIYLVATAPVEAKNADFSDVVKLASE